MQNGPGQERDFDRERRFERLVEQHQERLLRTCFLYLRDWTLAEDAVQETFLKAYRGLDAFRGDSSEKTWLMRIAMNVCLDMNRSGWFRLMNRRITPEMLPEKAAEISDDADEALTLAVMQLPRKMREVMLLYYYQGMNVQEIADVLHIAHSSVSGRLKRGRERLKRLMEGRGADE